MKNPIEIILLVSESLFAIIFIWYSTKQFKSDLKKLREAERKKANAALQEQQRQQV